VAYSPLTAGEVVTLPVTWQKDGAPFDLTGASLALIFDPVPGSPASNARFIGHGAWAVLNAPQGATTYTTTAADFVAGEWIITAVAYFGSENTLPRYADPIRILVRPAP
jgi:hypothetical protein